jgi:5-methylcytosine-specific restriction endonuclease McrA
MVKRVDTKEVQRLLRSGLSIRKTAKKQGVSHTTIRRKLDIQLHTQNKIQAKLWREKNAEKVVAYRKSDAVKKSKRKYVSNNLDKSAFYTSERRFLFRKAKKYVLSEYHRNMIKLYYRLSASLTCLTGVKYEVDHIVPLKGKNVSGLHVPWNLQILSKEENLKKGNKFV